MSIAPTAAALLITATLLPSATAQRTLVVASSGGAPFTEIQDAVNAATSGDVVLVRPGIYSFFVIDRRGVHILADAGAIVRPGRLSAFSVSNLGAGEDVVIAGLTTEGAALVSAFQNRGRVLFEDLSLPGVHVGVADCDSFAAHRLAAGSVSVESSNAALARCDLGGGPLHALDVHDSNVSFAHGSCGSAATSVLSRAGIRHDGGTLVVTGDANTVIRFTSAPANGSAPAVQTLSGTFTVAPTVRLLPAGSAPAVEIAGGQARFAPVPALEARVASGQLSTRLDAPGASFAALAAGFAASPPIPLGVAGTLWLDPTTAMLLAVGPVTAGQQLLMLSVPPLPLAAHITLQAAAVLPTNLALSSPVTLTVRR